MISLNPFLMLLFVSLALFASVAYGQTLFATSKILEVGFATVSSHEFGNIKTKTPFRKPRVIIGIPRNGIQTTDGGYTSVFRLRNIFVNNLPQTNNSFGLASFDIRFVQPNDSWCNYTWWHPIAEPNQKVSWIVMNQGHWFIGGGEFDIKNAVYNSHCTYLSFRHRWSQVFSNGTSRPISIAQVQSYKDHRFTSFREVDSNNNAVAVTLYIQLHNADRKWQPRRGDCLSEHYLDHYDNQKFRQAYTATFETVAVLGYIPQIGGLCTEGVAWETHQIDGITSDPRWLPFCWEYSSEPGVFGMVNSFKGGDDITVRSFNYTNFGVGVILQEDRCQGQSVIHIQGEKLSFLVIGPTDSRKPSHAGLVGFNSYSICKGMVLYDKCCNMTFTSHQNGYDPVTGQGHGQSRGTCGPTDVPTEQPTAEPTAIPTADPTRQPFEHPTTVPTAEPTAYPTPYPTAHPLAKPVTPYPTQAPVVENKICVL